MQAALNSQINKTDRNDARAAAGIRMAIDAAALPISEIGTVLLDGNGMNKSLTVVMLFSLALTCAAAAKSAAPVHVPLPRNNPLKQTEQEKKQNSPPASALFSEMKLPSAG